MPSHVTSPRQRRPAILIAAVFAFASAMSLAHPAPVAAWSSGSFSSTSERQLVSLTNRSRASAGLRSLRIDSTLTAIARWRSSDMSKRNYFSHSIPGYGSVFDKLSAVGYCYKLAGENIGWNTYPDDVATTEIHQMFMDSAPHRANILGRTWEAIGVGAYKEASGKKIWTVLFADKCGSTATRHTVSKPKPAPKRVAVVRPKSTPRPTPKPAVVTAPAPTPTPGTPSLASPLDPSLLVTASPEQTGEPPTESPGTAADASGAGFRVVDGPSPGGLVDTIVGGVTGAFFGA